MVRATVFRSEHGPSTGMVFDYENGARRAVGQCRLGVDAATAFDAPSRICFRTWLCVHPSYGNKARNRGTTVTFSSGDGCGHAGGEDD